MGYGANIISKWETMEEGLQFSNVAKQTSDLDTFTMADVMYMMLIDIVIYSLMTWYVVVSRAESDVRVGLGRFYLEIDQTRGKISNLDILTYTFGDMFSDTRLTIHVNQMLIGLILRYVEAVFPGDFGIKQKPWFMFTKTYWFGSDVNMDEVGYN